MPNYKKRTSMMMRETEKAIDILIAAQCQCEELYISAPETEITVLPVKDEEQGGHLKTWTSEKALKALAFKAFSNKLQRTP